MYNTINWRDTTHFDCEDDYRKGCRNVSHRQQQQSYWGLRSPGRSNSTDILSSVIQKAIQNIVLQQIEVTSFKDFPLLDSLGFLVPARHCDVGPASVMKRVRRGRKSEWSGWRGNRRRLFRCFKFGYKMFNNKIIHRFFICAGNVPLFNNFLSVEIKAQQKHITSSRNTLHGQ